MILQSLARYYETLAQQNKVARPGWEVKNVSFALCLNQGGDLTEVIPLKEEVQRGKKTAFVPQKQIVPETGVRPGSQIKPAFLCDNSTYLVGADQKGKPQRTASCFEASRDYHLKLLEGVNTPAACGVKRYFQTWQPERAGEHPVLQPVWEELLSGGNLVFMVDGQFVLQDEAVRSAWQEECNKQADGTVMQCLVTGTEGPIARLHSTIKGVAGAQSSGAALVSYNAPSFESYEKEQSYNGPVGEYAMFAYTTALNHLLASPENRMTLGDTTVVFWAEDGEAAYANAFFAGMNGVPSNDITDQDLKKLLVSASQGKGLNWKGVPLRPDNQFYILGLAPNAARLSVRFFLQDEFGAFIANLQAHHSRLDIVRSPYDRWEYLSVKNLLNETVNPNAQKPAPAPLLAGAVARAILSNGAYPAALFSAAMLRVRAQQDNSDKHQYKITRGRAAIVKAYLLKNGCSDGAKEALTVELNQQTSYPPYVLGRLFSVLESVQRCANPGINATIKDRYFNSACGTPAAVFPVLLKLSNHHLRKLEGGLPTYFERQIGQLLGRLNSQFPTHLNLQDQGIFLLGYYHQSIKKEEQENGGSN